METLDSEWADMMCFFAILDLLEESIPNTTFHNSSIINFFDGILDNFTALLY